MLENYITLKKVGFDKLNTLTKISNETFFDAFVDLNNKEDVTEYLLKNMNEEVLSAEILNTNSHFYLCYNHSSLCGYLKLNTGKAQTEDFKNALEIERLYILKTFQNQQIGTHLLQFAFAEAKKLTLNMVWLGVWENNKNAIRLYEKQGFQVFGSHEFSVGKDIQTDLLMMQKI